MTAPLVVTVPIRIESLNKTLRTHWAAKSRIGVRSDTWFALRAATRRFGAEFVPCVVTITRIAPRRLDKDDNLPGGTAKNVKDGIADWLGVDDGGSSVEWRYSQERGAPKEYACRISIEPRAA